MTVIWQLALSALVIGTATAALGTGRVTVPLVAGTTLIWLWVPVIQVLTGLTFIRGVRVPTLEALAAYFDTGRYWSCWLLMVTAAVLLAPQPFAILDYLILTASVPAALTARALARLARDLYGANARDARIRVLAHQAITYVIVVLYFAWAVALWPRLAPLVRS